MDLHLHLSFAFRSLDYKWGKPVDLDTSAETEVQCVPAVLEKPVTTFSSEDYLKKIKRSRPKPYSRIAEKRRRKEKEDQNDSFSNISIARIPSLSDIERSVSLDTRSNDDSLFGVMEDLIEDLERPLGGPTFKDSVWGSTETMGFCGSTGTLDSVVESRKTEVNSIFKELKQTAVAFVEKKYWKKMRR